ncbi:hypothetical protein FRB99_008064 [Tulasnella sp. 403]|nr:hypothetical protein FRB99_008064 [Tulasnella sp. 403]
MALYDHLGVEYHPANFTYSFSTLASLPTLPPNSERIPGLKTDLLYNGDNGRRGLGIPSRLLPATGKHLFCSEWGSDDLVVSIQGILLFAWSTFVILLNYAWLVLLSSPCRLWRPTPTERLDEWVRRTTPRWGVAQWLGMHKSWETFVGSTVLPLFSAVCTASEQDIWAHPATEILDYIWLGLFKPHYVVNNGVQDVVERLSAPLDPHHIHLSSRITSISPDPSHRGQVTIAFARWSRNLSSNDSSTGPQDEQCSLSGFSHVIFATQANQAASILEQYCRVLPKGSRQASAVGDIIHCLEHFEYRENIVVTHTDDRLLPHDRKDRRDLNLVRVLNPSSSIIPSPRNDQCVQPDFTMATHVINPPSPRNSFSTQNRPIYQTTNPILPPRPETIISVSRMQRALLTTNSKLALRAIFTDSASSESGEMELGPLQGAARRSPWDDGGDAEEPGIWLCGSYAYEGIPLLEGCVGSAELVVHRGILRSELS